MILKNKEFVWSLVLQGVVIFISAILLIRENTDSVLTLLVAGGIVIGINIIYTVRRYYEMRKLANYISAFSYGHERLDLLDSREGELSILKTELYKLCVTLLHQKELLNRDKEYLAESISDISHQLKTPLTSIMVMADLLEQDSMDPKKRKEFVHNIQNGLDRMNWLIQALLKIAKLDAGSIVLKREEVKAKEIIHQAARSFLVPIDLREQTLKIEGDENVIVLCDQAWTVEAISNIIKNCMEHTPPEGTITIRYGDNNLYSCIVIEDNGVGIAKEDLPHIFERFYRGKNSSSESVGIGLALSRKIMVNQKGTIEVTSTLNVGTKFILKFYR